MEEAMIHVLGLLISVAAGIRVCFYGLRGFFRVRRRMREDM